MSKKKIHSKTYPNYTQQRLQLFARYIILKRLMRIISWRRKMKLNNFIETKNIFNFKKMLTCTLKTQVNKLKIKVFFLRTCVFNAVKV